VSKDRDQYVQMLEGMRRGGTLGETDMLKAIAEYDALMATKALPVYALLSTIAAAISAIASAAAAFATLYSMP
jgi:hypothetical protein